MKEGKISESILKRSVLKEVKQRRSEVLVKASVGEDCSAIQVQEGEVLVLSTDPITGVAEDIGIYGVQITANDIASSGAEFIGIMLTILLPCPAEEVWLKQIMRNVESACRSLNGQVLGGHTEVTKAVNQPVLSITGVGKVLKEKLIKTSGARPGDEIVMTKWAGIEGTSIIAREKEEELYTRYSKEFVTNAKSLIESISVVPEAKIASSFGVSAMHDITEGGIFGALWELAEASKVGVEVDLSKIPVSQETVEICEFFDLNPYLLISSGSLLIATAKGNQLIEELEKYNIKATIIGRVVEGKERIVWNEDEKRFLEPPKSDELYKVIH